MPAPHPGNVIVAANDVFAARDAHQRRQQISAVRPAARIEARVAQLAQAASSRNPRPQVGFRGRGWANKPFRNAFTVSGRMRPVACGTTAQRPASAKVESATLVTNASGALDMPAASVMVSSPAGGSSGGKGSKSCSIASLFKHRTPPSASPFVPRSAASQLQDHLTRGEVFLQQLVKAAHLVIAAFLIQQA